MPKSALEFALRSGQGPALCAALLIGTACGPSASVTSERNDAVPIPAGATVQFRGAPDDASARVDQSVPNDSVHHRIQTAIRSELRRKGYTLVDSSASATFTVRYFLEVKTSDIGFAPTAGGVSGPAVGGYRGYGYGYGREGLSDVAAAPSDSSRDVSFEVSLVDEKLGRTAWRGMYAGKPQGNAPSQERVNQLAAKIFETLPRVP